MMKEVIASLAGYNRWANRRLYDAAAMLTDAQYREDRGAFFKSVHGTLNHILVGDRVWMSRFTGQGIPPDRLDMILYESFADLRAAREAEDERIVAFAQSLDDARLAGVIRFRRVSSTEEFEQPLAPAMQHFFNHQTHHRGQAHGLLTAIAGQAPELDLLLYQREAGLGGRRIN